MTDIKKSIFSLKDTTKERVTKHSGEMGINKSEFVELAIDNYDKDIDMKLATAKIRKEELQAKIDLTDEQITSLTELKATENTLLEGLEEQKDIFKENIKRKMEEGDILKAVEIAKRVGRLFRCSYLELMPKK